MKRILFLILAVIGTLTAHAEEYTYLTFETTDGAKASVSVSSLSITISGTTLTAGDKSFTISNLSKMYFSVSDDTTGITSVSTQELNEATEIFDLNGRKVSKDQVTNGVYVIKSKKGTYKIAVK
ncbi:MAG: hypothetical protein J5486_02750 [Bacteroidaceae bacterium]|nr:hypothetical protein [Bacteroidaceae bacterium]